MRKAAVLIAVLVLAVGCSTTGAVTGNTGILVESSTTDFAVNIRQTSTPQVFRTHTAADVMFELEIVNQTAETYTVERISLQTMSGASYNIPVSTRAYEARLAPGESKKLAFWATATVLDGTARLPVTVRATIEARADGGAKREEVFAQNVNGRVSVAAMHMARNPRKSFDAPAYLGSAHGGSVLGSTPDPSDFVRKH
jgi:hypothetical protein